MSKRKGVSADEKRSRMLELFYEKKEFFLLKELETIAPKEKGIIAGSVKDVVQSLVDEDLVDSEKIGTSIYFWAFPSKVVNARKRAYSEMSKKLEEDAIKLQKIKDKVKSAKEETQESEERSNILRELAELEMEEKKLGAELEKYKDNDPEAVETMQREVKMSQEAINRWTDNIFSFKTWAKNKFSIEEKEMNKQFGIPEDLDYLSF